MNPENDLILLEIGTRLKRIEEILELVVVNHKVHALSIETLLMKERLKWEDGQNG